MLKQIATLKSDLDSKKVTFSEFVARELLPAQLEEKVVIHYSLFAKIGSVAMVSLIAQHTNKTLFQKSPDELIQAVQQSGDELMESLSKESGAIARNKVNIGLFKIKLHLIKTIMRVSGGGIE